jgi:D-aspartate ligase
MQQTPNAAKALAVVLAEGENGLGAVRSLAQAGIQVLAITLSEDDPVLFSRYARKIVIGQEVDPVSSLLKTLHEIDHPFQVVIPTSDYFVHLLAAHRDLENEGRVFAMPSNELLAIFRDKGTETRRIAATGVPIPKSVQEIPADFSELLNLLPLPMIFKPRTVLDKQFLQLKTLVATTPAELAALAAQYGSERGRLIAQECIPGDDQTLWVCDCVFNRQSELVGALTFQKISTSPAHYGVTSLGVSRRNDEVVQLVRKIGQDLGYVGPADFDFKYDARDLSYKYLEINPRVGMCNSLGSRCGVNSVLDAYNVAAGYPESPQPIVQKDGVYYFDLHDDLYSRRKDGEGFLSILRTYSCLLPRRRVHPYFSWSDPRPGWKMLLRQIRKKLS